jgi:hypothetical protein
MRHHGLSSSGKSKARSSWVNYQCMVGEVLMCTKQDPLTYPVSRDRHGHEQQQSLLGQPFERLQ